MRFLLLLLFCSSLFAQTKSAPEDRIEVWGTVLQVLEKSVIVQPKTNSNVFVLEGHPDQETLVDNAEILVWAKPAGRVQFKDGTGATRTLPKLVFLEKSKNVYHGH